MENSIGYRIEEKYTRYLNCETDTLELTIEEAIFILETDESLHYVEDLLQEAYKVILSEYKRVLKENEELKEKENKIYKEVQESLAFEKFLIVKERKPDLFNQGRFYISQIIYDILNDVQNPEGIHKENKCIQYIDYIPVQKVKEKIEELDKKRRKFTSDNVNNFYLQEFTRKYTQKSDHDYGVFSTPETITYCTNNELLGRIEALQELLREE